MASHPGLLVGEHTNVFFHCYVSHTDVDVRQSSLYVNSQFFIVKDIPLSVGETVLQLMTALGPSCDGLGQKTCASSEGSVCRGDE